MLIGFQGFRIAVELLIARAYREGLAAVQMTYHGRNFDVVTGLTAVGVAVLLASGRLRPRLVWIVAGGWNVLGSALLLNVLVVAGALGHVLVYQRLYRMSRSVVALR